MVLGVKLSGGGMLHMSALRGADNRRQVRFWRLRHDSGCGGVS